MSTLVFVDITKGLTKSAKETVFFGKEITAKTGGQVHVLAMGTDATAAGELGKVGAQAVHLLAPLTDNQQLTRAIVKAAGDVQAKLVICTHDALGKAIAPRVAAKLNAGFVAGAIEIPNTDNGFVVKVNAFSGKAWAHMQIVTDVKVLSLLPNSIPVNESGGVATVSNFTGDFGHARVTVKNLLSEGGALPLPEAELVVSAGRGLKGPEHWGIVEELATTLGAATACSRPVADMHWRPHHEHVGQTGVAIRPNLYIAAGISGAIQHLAGVNGSKVIVVINKDPEAPFFKAADYGVLGDAFEVLPRLNEALKKFKASHN